MSPIMYAVAIVIGLLIGLMLISLPAADEDE
jgi:hypothetical protein